MRDRDGEFVAAQARHQGGAAGFRVQSFGHRAQHEVAAGVAEHVVDLLEGVEADHQQRDLAPLRLRRGNHRGEAGVKAVAVGEPGEGIVFGQIANSFGFALSHRYVAQDRAMLKAVGALPAGETGLDRKYLAVLAAAVELHHQAAGRLRSGARRLADCVRDGGNVVAAGADRIEPPADHLGGLVAEYRRRPRIPHRDQVVLIGTYQAVAQRHRDALEAALGDPAQQTPEIDFVERNRGHVDDDRGMEQRRVENERKSCLQQSCGDFNGGGHADEDDNPHAGGETAPRQHHDQRNDAQPGQRDGIGGQVQGSVLQDRFGGESLQQRAGNNAAIGNAETVAEFQRGAADDDLLVPELAQRRLVAAQDIDIGHLRNRRGADAEIDQEGRALLGILFGQHRAHRGKKLPVECLAERIAPDQAVRFNRDIHDRRP